MTQDENGPPRGSQEPQELDAFVLGLTALQHQLAGMQGQVQSLLVLASLELRARAARGGAPAPQGPPGALLTTERKGSLLEQLETELRAQQRGSGATFMRGAAAPAAAPPPAPPPSTSDLSGGTDGNERGE